MRPTPDIAATIYALNNRNSSLGEAQSALVKVVTEQSLARGQTIMGLTFIDRITMIASAEELSRLADQVFAGDPTFDLDAALAEIASREPDNAQVVLEIKEQRIHQIFMTGIKD